MPVVRGAWREESPGGGMNQLIGLVFPVLIGGLATVLTLNPEWLRDKPHPDEPAYRQHESSRVVRVAPEREEVKA